MGTAQQVRRRMYQYAEATARDLPFLWQPDGCGISETAPYAHGMNKYFNAVQGVTQMNWVTISH